LKNKRSNCPICRKEIDIKDDYELKSWDLVDFDEKDYSLSTNFNFFGLFADLILERVNKKINNI